MYGHLCVGALAWPASPDLASALAAKRWPAGVFVKFRRLDQRERMLPLSPPASTMRALLQKPAGSWRGPAKVEEPPDRAMKGLVVRLSSHMLLDCVRFGQFIRNQASGNKALSVAARFFDQRDVGSAAEGSARQESHAVSSGDARPRCDARAPC